MPHEARFFRYGLDPLCFTAGLFYLCNRELIKPMTHGYPFWLPRFMHDHFNDLLLVPVALPIYLWGYRQMGLRNHDAPPTGREIFFHVLLWSLFFEVFGPYFLHRGTADFWDAVSYGLGGTIAWLIWNGFEFRRYFRINLDPA